jgi:hypothetical protein
MGADITFYNADGKEVFYFRDAYNSSNLAGIRRLSYWGHIGAPYEQLVAFFDELAAISDAEIQRHAAAVHQRLQASGGIQEIGNLTVQEEVDMLDEQGGVRLFQQKRDRVRQHLPVIRRAMRVQWDV